MQIRSLTATAFRNLGPDRLEFHPGLNLLVGRNGQGKTNVLEGLSVVSGRGSFRTADLTDVVCAGEGAAQVVCALHGVSTGDGLRDGHLAVSVQSGRREQLWNGRRVSRIDALNLLPLVLLTDGDRSRLDGPPAHRRRALDRAAAALDSPHVANLQRYERARAAKTRLLGLPVRPDPDEIGVYDEVLASTGASIAVARRAVIGDLAREIGRHATLLGSPYRDLLPRLGSDLPETGTETTFREQLRILLARRSREERSAGRCLVGPHRDDLTLVAGGEPVSRRASSGERRTLVLAWTLAERALLTRSLGFPPMLGFDDFDSEWDPAVLSCFARALPGDGQVLLTSARPDAVRGLPLPAGLIHRVEAGRVTADAPIGTQPADDPGTERQPGPGILER